MTSCQEFDIMTTTSGESEVFRWKQRNKGKNKMAIKKVLAQGNGIAKMMETCYKKHYITENSELKVKDPADINSSWVIYSK